MLLLVQATAEASMRSRSAKQERLRVRLVLDGVQPTPPPWSVGILVAYISPKSGQSNRARSLRRRLALGVSDFPRRCLLGRAQSTSEANSRDKPHAKRVKGAGGKAKVKAAKSKPSSTSAKGKTKGVQKSKVRKFPPRGRKR